MADILIKAGAFVSIIVLGFVLRRVGFFKEGDFHILSKIVLKITMPAAIVANFAGAVVKPSLLVLSLLGLGGGVLMILLAVVLTTG
ncbi:MAG: AEC family transporter, partial [Lachnospiraceae bacterium]|nr:AEC family transporter [Lachnospiraceae bacterium]